MIARRTFLPVVILALACGLALAQAAQPGAESGPGTPRLVLVGVEIDDIFTGNASLWIEPGETADLKLLLYNEGNETAIAPIGTLEYLGNHPDVSLLGKSASWPDLPPLGSPSPSDPPSFQITLGSTFPCGLDLPFRLSVSVGSGEVFQFDLALRAGRRTDYDLIHDAARRVNEQEATFWGSEGGFGRTAATGDVNGDGYADLIVGAPFDSTAGSSAGAVFIIYGDPNRWPTADLATPISGVVKFTGAAANNELGNAVATGDLNRDGYDDVIVSASRFESMPGKVYVIFGQPSMWTGTSLASPLPPGIRSISGETYDILGLSVASGDLNGDGYDDLIMSAENADGPSNGRPVAGEVQILLGSPAMTFSSLDVIRVYGAASLDAFGAVVGAVDLNGDGMDDLLALDRVTSVGRGHVVVVYGTSGWATDIDLLDPPATVRRFIGPEAGSGYLGQPFGQKVFPTGDVNDDGYDDLILVFPNTNPAGIVRNNAGVAFLVYGKSTMWEDTNLQGPHDGIVRFYGPVADGFMGSGAMGDLNGDGFDEVILGVPESDALGRTRVGQIFVLPGQAQPWTDTDLASLPSRAWRFSGGDAIDRMGQNLATGDVDGDGVEDLVAGVTEGDSVGNSRFNAGEAYLWYGKPTETYSIQVDPLAYIDASSGTPLPLSCDDCSAAVPIGFSFPFYGEMRDTIHVSSNGFLSFDPIQNPASFIPACQPDRRADQALIAPLWDDLNPASGGPGSGVFTLLEGSEPNRRLTIEWKDIPHYPAIGAATFEVTLFESTGQILVQYQDLAFGDQAHDNAASAAIGVENRAGIRGMSVSCLQGGVVAGGVAFRLIPTTPVVETGFEHGVGLFQTAQTFPNWHLADGACEPDQRSGETSWYFGIEPSCTFDRPGQVSQGALRVPTIPDFPADGRLAFWSRRKTEGTPGFDISRVQISSTGTGGVYSDVLDVADEADAWIYAGATSLSGHGGDTIDLQFYFDSIDDFDNGHLGWMVDDVQVYGCGAEGLAAAGASALAYARPEAFCAGGTGLVDAAGSFCADAGSIASYQWREDGAPIAGATSISYTIPSSQPAGAFDYSVEIACPGGATDESAAVQVSVVPPPGLVGATLTVGRSAGDLVFNWADVAGADEYAVYSSADPSIPSFTTLVGVSPSGSTGLTAPLPAGNLVYYLVAGRNAVCGEGLQR